MVKQVSYSDQPATQDTYCRDTPCSHHIVVQDTLNPLTSSWPHLRCDVGLLIIIIIIIIIITIDDGQVCEDHGKWLPGGDRVGWWLVEALLLDRRQAAASGAHSDLQQQQQPCPAPPHLPVRRCLRRYRLRGALQVLDIHAEYVHIYIHVQCDTLIFFEKCSVWPTVCIRQYNGADTKKIVLY